VFRNKRKEGKKVPERVIFKFEQRPEKGKPKDNLYGESTFAEEKVSTHRRSSVQGVKRIEKENLKAKVEADEL